MRRRTHMNTSSETETRSEPTTSEEQHADSLGNFGLIHLAACLGAGAAVVLAITLIDWIG
jgi:hypothetical protein